MDYSVSFRLHHLELIRVLSYLSYCARTNYVVIIVQSLLLFCTQRSPGQDHDPSTPRPTLNVHNPMGFVHVRHNKKVVICFMLLALLASRKEAHNAPLLNCLVWLVRKESSKENCNGTKISQWKKVVHQHCALSSTSQGPSMPSILPKRLSLFCPWRKQGIIRQPAAPLTTRWCMKRRTGNIVACGNGSSDPPALLRRTSPSRSKTVPTP